ncbi:hypothetical protein I3F58_02495 [Streptomyces sp. MUM 203J]|nr:hypothetical protein [Streptomyces sp. MUM 203J]
MQPQDPAASTANSADNTVPPTVVEDFSYPGAAQLFEETGVKLIQGDGGILQGECDGSSNQILVYSRALPARYDNQVCFKAVKSYGHLTLELPEVFGLWTKDRPVSAALTAEGKTQTVKLTKNDFKSVGEGAQSAPTMLVELHVTG